MSSINDNQPENNRDDMQGREAVAKMQELVEKAETCFFCTTALTPGAQAVGARPMNVRQVDRQGHLWFLSASDSHLNAELESLSPDGGAPVHLFFQGSAHAGFLHLTGHATVSRDKAKIHELWEPLIKTWFTEGEDDPRITVIEVTPVDGYYWDNKHGNFVAGLKIAIGAMTGTTLDDSIEGKLQVQGAHAAD